EVIDNGDGSYTIDDATLGLPCGTDATSGTLFNLAVSSAVAGGTGTVVIDDVTLRDCSNASMPSAIGTSASVAIDNTAPAVAVVAPNGAETWVANSPQTITWSATDAAGIANVDLAYSTDGGATYPHSIATG